MKEKGERENGYDDDDDDDEDVDTLESSRRAFSRSSGLLSSRTSCSEEAIELEEAGERRNRTE